LRYEFGVDVVLQIPRVADITREVTGRRRELFEHRRYAVAVGQIGRQAGDPEAPSIQARQIGKSTSACGGKSTR